MATAQLNLEAEVRGLLLSYAEQKLVEVRPVTYDRLMALGEDCRDRREWQILKTALQYCFAVDSRSLAFLERTALNWLQKGVPSWAFDKISQGGYTPDQHLAKEVGWHGTAEGPTDYTQDEFYHLYRRS